MITQQAKRSRTSDQSTWQILHGGSEDGSENAALEHPFDPKLEPFTGSGLKRLERAQLIKRTQSEPVVSLTPFLTAINAQRIAELEDDLDLAREELARGENEICSLQASLELVAGENASLSLRLSESDELIAKLGSQLERVNAAAPATETEGAAAVGDAGEVSAEGSATVDRACAQLERLVTALTASEHERNKTGAALGEINEQREIETNAFMSQLDALLSRAVTAETLLAQAQQSLSAHDNDHDLRLAENARLSRRLEENDAALENICSRLEQENAAKIAAIAQADALRTELDKAGEQHSTEINALTERLAAMSARAIAAEALLKEAGQSLRDKFQLLRTSLAAEVEKNQGLEQTRSILAKGAVVLRQTVHMRDQALANSEATIKLLVKRMCASEIK